MRWLKILATTLVIGGVIFVSACSSNSSSTVAKPQYATVQRGNISIQVTGTGNLALETKDSLAFQMAGTVNDVPVSVSDSVKKGQTLAELDTTDWNNQIKALQKTLTNTQRSLTTSQRNVTTAQNNVTKAQNQIAVKQLAVQQAHLDLQSSQDGVGQIASVKSSQDAIDTAQLNLKTAQANYQMALASGDNAQASYLLKLISGDPFTTPKTPGLQDALTQAQNDLKAILNGTSIKATSDVELQVSQAQLQVQQKQNALQTALNAVNDANQAVTDAQTAVTDVQTSQADAEQAVKDAQSALDQSNSLSPIITAPYDGIITKVNVKGGDTVQKGTIAAEIADPNHFKANIMVSEQDIFSVKVGGDATVSLDALTSGLTFPAKVTTIAPTATIQQGVVNYAVTVELTALRPSVAGLTGNGQFSGQFGNGNGSAIPSGTPSATRTARPPSASGSPQTYPTATPNPTSTAGVVTGTPNLPTTLPTNIAGLAQGFTLKDGLSSTVNIMVSQQTNVLLVPSRAITRVGRNSTVQLVQGNTNVATTVQTGISDSTNTEIMSGVNEGDQIALPTATTTSTSSANRPAGGLGGGSFQIIGRGG